MMGSYRAIGMVILGCVVAGSVITFLLDLPLLLTKRERGRYSRSEFSSYFTRHGISPQICETVYDHFSHGARAAGFSPMPTDDLGSIYGLALEDLDECFLELAGSCNLGPKEIESVNRNDLIKVKDIVFCLGECARPTSIRSS